MAALSDNYTARQRQVRSAGGYSPSAALVRAIVDVTPDPAFRAVLLATTLAESGGRTNGPAGDNGRSWGAYQEYDLGRGAGIPISGRQDPVASTRRAFREFGGYRTVDPGTWAANAQRPADKAAYAQKINQLIPVAQRFLPASPSAQGAPTISPGTAAVTAGTASGGTLTSASMKAIQDYLRATERQVMAGKTPSDPGDLLAKIKFAQVAVQAPQATASPVVTPATGAPSTPMPGGAVGGLSLGGGPSAHASRALGNWQSDNAYDLMGSAGQRLYAPIAGTVSKVSGQPGGDPGFAGYGITVRTAEGDLFFKHLGSTPLRAGATIRPGQLVGTLDAATAGGPHLHLGGTNRGLLDRLSQAYTGRS